MFHFRAIYDPSKPDGFQQPSTHGLEGTVRLQGSVLYLPNSEKWNGELV